LFCYNQSTAKKQANHEKNLAEMVSVLPLQHREAQH